MSTSAFVWLGVAVGGTIGALARFAVSTGLTGWLGSGFPWGTLAVNLLGHVLPGRCRGMGTRRAGGRPSCPQR